MPEENSNEKSGELKVWTFVSFSCYPFLRQEKEVIVEDAEELSIESFIRCCETMEEKKKNHVYGINRTRVMIKESSIFSSVYHTGEN